ncbi:P-loop NTPase fold protein [Streptomyces xiaopingdaonensis]|uniref:P-loop NTPase fold protein n=1 Tax=Streptomyces xiaopingdaonensis TaxID=1565415 RepID=UPI000314816D|nr:P-loop NTPase fold protein [Streptomyces xiaopingdaonensis]
MDVPVSREFALLDDEPVARQDDDALGTGRTARLLAELVLSSRSSTPFTLAVESGWGTGKSSLMLLLRRELDKEEDVRTVWFNAWSSPGADALEGLIRTVLAGFDRRTLRRNLRNLSEHCGTRQALRLLSLLAAVPLGATAAVEETWRLLSANPESRNRMQERIRDLTREWAAGGEHGERLLVVFVDDLDRCSEETVLAVCEAVKVYLDVPRVAFVVGCDRSALDAKGLLRELSAAGAAFLEKVFQTSYRMSVPEKEEVEEFVRRCLRRAGIERLLDDEHVSLIANRSGRNPRRIKRLVNGLVLEARLNPLWRDFGPGAVGTLLRLLLVQHLYPEFYRLFARRDAAYPGPFTEFTGYRAVRNALLRGDAADPAQVNGFFAEHGLPEPEGEPATVLGELEERLPTEFPSLVEDRPFVTLVEDLNASPHWEKVLDRLEWSDGRQEEPAHPEAERPAATVEEPLLGRRLLWIDDNPASVTHERRHLEALGADVDVVPDEETARAHLRRGHPDLLLSDITRGGDRAAGFGTVRRLKADGYKGPVLFYTGRVTPERESRARELGAQVTADPSRLRSAVLWSAGRDART